MSKRKSLSPPQSNTLLNYFSPRFSSNQAKPSKKEKAPAELDSPKNGEKHGMQTRGRKAADTPSPSTSKRVKPSNKEKASAKLDSSMNGDEDAKVGQNKRERELTNSPEVFKRTDSEDEASFPSIKRKRIRLNLEDSDDSVVEIGDSQAPSENAEPKKTLQDRFGFKANNSKTDINQAGPSSNPDWMRKLQERYECKENNSTKTKTDNNETTSIITVSDGSSENQDKPAADEGEWVHMKHEWLQPKKVRDAKKRRPDDPDYDPSTLYVPPEFIKAQTPAHRQWWEMKATHYDCVLFFKVGKFYELYHMDAVVGVTELGFSYMKGEFAHSGFPESAYARMASTLVAKGYKVARIEQTETPEMMQERIKTMRQSTKWDKVVRREICQVTVRGTQVCGLLDAGPNEDMASYMVSVTEEESQGYSSYGVCFVDTSIGLFHLGQFKDDTHSSRLLTTLAHYPPALIVYDRKNVTPQTARLLATHCHSARREARTMWAPEKTLQTLAEKYYRKKPEDQWPEGLNLFLHDGDVLGLTPAPNCSLAIKALGGCVSYLTDCLLDIQVLGMSQFTSYVPPDVLNKTLSYKIKAKSEWERGNTMVLDAITLRNLRIVQEEGCLYDKLNFCSTPFGKRLLYQWVCAPSCNPSVIKARQEAVKELFENEELFQEAKKIMKSLPDMERLLAKIHTLGNLQRSQSHPDSRAIFFVEKQYSKRKVLDFISLLNGFAEALKLTELFYNAESALLNKIFKFSPKGKFPNYTSTLKYFKEAFNQTEAQKEGVILPGEGVDHEYDSILQTIKKIQKESKEYLSDQERVFNCRLKYVGSDKKRFQIEAPIARSAGSGANYKLESVRKGFNRYSTVQTREFLSRMMAAEDQKTTVLKDLSRRIFEKFSSYYYQWEIAVECLATFDILLAFAEFARQQSNSVCLPEVTFEKDKTPYISIVEGRHPCIPVVNEFIPNDTLLTKESSLLLLTGPNMGGKSTLMRQVGLLTVLAHLGSYVPAQECKLSLVDRIFTRLGASDDILSGKSTFLVEMNETAAIVKHSTIHSLVLLDELGRGTSTYDGAAIASAVCIELAKIGCRAVFSTHYHSVVDQLASKPQVVMGHMACMVETETAPDSEDAIPEETITFLYKLTPGACPKSYGFNAARLAGIPKDITQRAHVISKSLESEATCVRDFKDMLMLLDDNSDGIREILANSLEDVTTELSDREFLFSIG